MISIKVKNNKLYFISNLKLEFLVIIIYYRKF